MISYRLFKYLNDNKFIMYYIKDILEYKSFVFQDNMIIYNEVYEYNSKLTEPLQTAISERISFNDEKLYLVMFYLGIFQNYKSKAVYVRNFDTIKLPLETIETIFKTKNYKHLVVTSSKDLQSLGYNKVHTNIYAKNLTYIPMDLD